MLGKGGKRGLLLGRGERSTLRRANTPPMFSPLEQFSLIPILPLTLGNTIVLSFSNATLFTLVSMGLVLALVKLTLGPGVRGGALATPSQWQTLFESF